VRLASNPEFLREGHAVADFMHADRIIIGHDDAASAADLHALYAPLTESGTALVETTPVSAEMIKYAANCYLATRLSFFNEISDLCEMTGASYAEVSRGVAMDARIGHSFMKAGPGYGGSCFPKDTLALDALARDIGATLALNGAAIAANNRRKSALLGRIETALGAPVKGARIALLGLAFKADTDDVRESPALVLAKDLMAAGADLVAFDPAAMGTARRVLPALPVADSAMAAAQGADALVIITEWPEFAGLDASALARAMRGRTVIDLRHITDSQALAAAGFTVHRVGESPIAPKTRN
jgi:UDPglucose 6-dehydrogenase